MQVKGTSTRAGAIALNASFPREDAPFVRDLKASGALVLAKANMDTFAMGGASASEVAGQVKNPYGPEIASPSGSSCGNGAGGAAVFAVLGVGSDTSGSVMMPSANANLIGFNLAKDKINMNGVFPLSPICDRAGPMVRYAEDLAEMLDILDTSIPNKPFYTRPEVLNRNGLQGLKIGYLQLAFRTVNVVDEVLTWNATPEVRRLFDRVLFNLVRGGASVKACPALTHDDLFILEHVRVINEANMMTTCLANDVDHYFKGVTADSPYHNADDLVASGLLPLQMGLPLSIALTQREQCNASYTYYTDARNYFRELYVEPLFECGDIIISLMNDEFPDVKKGSMTATHLGYLFGHPQMVFPLGFSEPKPGAPKGLPISVFATTKPGNEHLLVRMAYAYQQTYGSGVVLPASVPAPIENAESSPTIFFPSTWILFLNLCIYLFFKHQISYEI